MNQKVKYVYVLGSVTIATYSFIKMIHEKYDPTEHLFYIPFGKAVLKVLPQMQEFDNVCYPPAKGKIKQFFYELKLYRTAKKLILHGMFTGTKPMLPLLLLLILFSKQTQEKLAWIEHGGDLYNWQYPYNNWKKPFIDWMNRKIRESASVLGVCHPADEVFLRSEFRTTAPCYYTQLRTMADPFAVFEEVHIDKIKRTTKIIQIGHNAFQLGNHIHILDMLEKFRHEDIQLILPMSYGLTGIFGDVYGGHYYRKAVNIIAKTTFGEKSILFYKNIPQKNYFQYLWNVDIVIFDLYRQAGLGNIHPLLYMNKKIFLPAGTVLYEWLTSQGLEIYDTNQIPSMSFDEFVASNKGSNREWVVDFLSKNGVGLWDAFFEELESRVT